MVKDALEYLDSLANEASGDRTLQRELATAYQKIGDVQGNSNMANLGDTSGALASYRKSLAIRRLLAQSDPANTDLRSRGTLTKEFAGKLDEIPRKIAACDAALAKNDRPVRK